MATSSPRLSILLAAALFSTGGAAIKACDLTSWQVACFRSGVAGLALLVLLPQARKHWSWRTWVCGIAYATTMICFVVANKLTTAANAIFLQSVSPLYVMLLAPLFLRERLYRRDLWCAAAMLVGLVVLLQDQTAAAASAPDPGLGNAVAVMSGVGWALTVLCLRWLAREEQPAPRAVVGPVDPASGETVPRGAAARDASAGALVVGNLIACVACLPMVFPVRTGGVGDFAIVGYLGVFQIGIAYVALSRGMRRVPALEASLLLLLEPVLNPVWAWMVQGERPGVWTFAGGAAILGATIARAWWDAAQRRVAARGGAGAA